MESIEGRPFYRQEHCGGFSPENSTDYPHCSSQNYDYPYGDMSTMSYPTTSPAGNENTSPHMNYSYTGSSPGNHTSWDGYPYSYPNMHPNIHLGQCNTAYHSYDEQNMMGQNGKPKRRRVATVAQRRAANIRERRRMCNLNEAFDELRKMVPTFAYEKRLSRIESLRLAITYISFMADVVNGKNPKEVKLTTLKPTGWCALKQLAESVNIHGVPPPMS